MTELQKMELDIFKAFIDVCEELELKYFLVCGTALGAVKYGGFIPWDDDIDVGLYREDYEVFCEKAQEYLPNYYFLQNYKTDIEFPLSYSKIRDNRTTFIEESTSILNINHGLYIDIFPLDGYPKSKTHAMWFEFKKRIIKLQISCAFKIKESYSLKAKAFFRLERFFGYHKRTFRTLEKLERLYASYSPENSEMICNHGNWQGKLEYSPKWHYGNGEWKHFEGINVRVPQNYDAYLTQKYGEWRADLPLEKQTSHHNCEIIDLNHSYIEYKK